MIREPVAVASWVLAAAVALAPERIRSHRPGVDRVAIAVAFCVSAAATRYWLQETRTREQILAFAAAAAVLGFVRSSIEGRPYPTARVLAGAFGASAGALLVKFRLEGLPI